MRDWPACIELTKKISDFNESIPLLQLMANPVSSQTVLLNLFEGSFLIIVFRFAGYAGASLG